MQNYLSNHRDYSFEVSIPNDMKILEKYPYRIRLIDLSKAYCWIASGPNKTSAKRKLVKITNTPHFNYLKTHNNQYISYLERYGTTVGFGNEHSLAAYEKLIKSKKSYLEKPFNKNYLLGDSVKNIFGKEKIIITNGVHRASILLFQNQKFVPMAVFYEPGIKLQSQLTYYLNDYENSFREWYTPIKLGEYIIHERTYPNYVIRKEYYSNKERGMSKWNYIIKKNLPKLQNKRVFDIGCNNGFFSVLLSKSGAKMVTGIDRSDNIYQPTNKQLPSQDVVNQAYFVKNLFELEDGKKINNIQFMHMDIQKLNFSKLECDLLYATCILYHFGKKRFTEIIKQASKNIPEIFLQTNLGHIGGELGEAASIKFHVQLLEKYGYSVKVDAPVGYNYPVIYGKKSL